MAEHAACGKKLLAESKYLEAVDSFTSALKTSPTSPDYLIQRSIAHQRSKQYSEALQDAEAAVVYAHKRAKRELIVQAQLRRGIALFNLERYGDSKYALDIVKRMDAKEKSVDLWLSKSTSKLAAATSDEEKHVTITDIPDIDPEGEKSKSAVGMASAPQATPADKIRHDWYQNANTVYFSLLAKGVPQDKAAIEITETSLSISFPVAGTESTYDYTIDPFFALVDPAKSNHRILPSKIEITLAKAVAGKWSTLEGTGALASTTHDQAPSYPTSARSGTKNWDKIVNEQGTSKDGLEDFEGGDDATKFFKQLYQGASPETQRAMMKSYTESNGTALSTDWSEVSKKKVETLPPDGMVAREWDK